jgi:3-oxoacyl-(acyl-carrier-protein) synthase
VRGEGAVVLVLESPDHARARGAEPLGEIRGVAWRGLPARPNGVGRRVESRAIRDALDAARVTAAAVRWVYGSASNDRARDAWERALLTRALGPDVRVASLAPLAGQHAGLGPLRVAAAAWTAGHGLFVDPSWSASSASPVAVPGGPGLVHGIARGGTHVALVVDSAAASVDA